MSRTNAKELMTNRDKNKMIREANKKADRRTKKFKFKLSKEELEEEEYFNKQ